MNKKDLKHFEKILSERRAKLLKELNYFEEQNIYKGMKESSGELSSYSYHLADQATDSGEVEKAFHFASREGDFLKHLDEALDRVKKGTYGTCRECNKPISKDRLEAVPHATLCINCKKSR
ncbi:MAG: TraR/DksA C4-type zinc finger protein [bacterium]